MNKLVHMHSFIHQDAFFIAQIFVNLSELDCLLVIFLGDFKYAYYK